MPSLPTRQDQPGRGQVERQPHHRGDQKDGRERTEFQWLADEHRRHQDQDGKAQREGGNKISSSQVGNGGISTTRIAMIPIARPRSDFLTKSMILPGRSPGQVLRWCRCRHFSRSSLCHVGRCSPGPHGQIALRAFSRSEMVHRTISLAYGATAPQPPQSAVRHGWGMESPESEYSRSLLRRVRIEMPRILAAWVRLPRQWSRVSRIRSRSTSS